MSTRHAQPAVALAAAVLAVAAAGPGCTVAVWSQTRFAAGRDPAAVAGRLAQDGLPESKAQALERLGPPLQIVPLADGELFVWRMRRTTLDVLNLHTGLVGLPQFPLYAAVDGRQQDRLLLLRFAHDGRLLDHAAPEAP